MMIPTGEQPLIAGGGCGVVLPERYRDCEQSFASLAYDFIAYARERGLFNIEVCCPEGCFMELELCSVKKRLGRFFLASSITGTLFWGVMSEYIYDQIKTILPQVAPVEAVERPQFLDAPEVSFSIVIPDSLENRQEITYEAPWKG